MNQILFLGDAMEAEPKLSAMREQMPEPSSVDYPFIRTLEPPRPPTTYGFYPEIDRDPIGYVHDWEKIKMVDGGATFWAWRHRPTMQVFI